MNKRVWTSSLVGRCCPLCGQEDMRVLSHKMQHRLDLRTVICNHCTMVFTNPIPSEELYNRFYRDAYSTFYGSIAGVAPAEALREPVHVGMILDTIEKLRPLASARLMEIGPGKGQFLYWAIRRGATALGIEPSKSFFDLLVKRGLPCLNTTFEDVSLDIGKFDMVAMFHVMEHFYDPNRTIEQLRSFIADDGILIIIVPNVLKPFRSLERYFLRYVHPSNFSPDTLTALLAKHGFKVDVAFDDNQNWYEPQSLFVIARKLQHVPDTFPLPAQTPNEVEKILSDYQDRWNWYGRYCWYVHRYSSRIQHLVRRAARYIKKKSRKDKAWK